MIVMLHSMTAWRQDAAARGVTLPQWVVMEQAAEAGQTEERILQRLEGTLLVMEEALAAYDGARRSDSGLSGGQGAAMEAWLKSGAALSGPFMGEVIIAALKMAETNACMGRIVAAPTAGSCGVLPAVLLTAGRHLNLPREQLVDALALTGGVGAVIGDRATLSGAGGGCQAEVGAASAMAAAALVYLRGGDPMAVDRAVALALGNLLGLVCDPVAGLVEVPCVARNVIGAVGAVAAADMVLSGIPVLIPADEAIDAMGRVGTVLPLALRETGEGGLAATPTGRATSRRLFGPTPEA